MPLHCALGIRDDLLGGLRPMWRIKVGMAHATEVDRTVRTSLAVTLCEKMETRKLPVMHTCPSQTASTVSLFVVTTVFLAADGEHDGQAHLGAEAILSPKPRYGAEVKRKELHKPKPVTHLPTHE